MNSLVLLDEPAFGSIECFLDVPRCQDTANCSRSSGSNVDTPVFMQFMFCHHTHLGIIQNILSHAQLLSAFACGGITSMKIPVKNSA